MSGDDTTGFKRGLTLTAAVTLGMNGIIGHGRGAVAFVSGVPFRFLARRRQRRAK